MTEPQKMMADVAAIIRQHLSHLMPIAGGGSKIVHPEYNKLREALQYTEAELRKLITGCEDEVHEWMAAIHYALADERARLLN